MEGNTVTCFHSKVCSSRLCTKESPNYLFTTEESIEHLIRPLLFQKIMKELPTGTQLLEDKVLQVSIQDDKVKGKILLLINENIAIPHVIPQGDEA